MLMVALQVEEATVVMEDDGPAEPASTPGTLRNLSAWNISIPLVHSFDDEAKREKIPMFCIDVERHDRREGEEQGEEVEERGEEVEEEAASRGCCRRNLALTDSLCLVSPQWATPRRPGPSTGGTWSSTSWSPSSQSSTVSPAHWSRK